MTPVIHDVRLLARWPNGNQTPIAVRIHAPRRVDDSPTFGCPVMLAPWLTAPRDIYGVSTRQARKLAKQLCERLIQSCVERGAQVVFTDGRAYKGRLIVKPRRVKAAGAPARSVA